MKHVLVSDDIGTPIYFDHPDGRMMCMPIATTHDMMVANFGAGSTFQALSCGPLRIVFHRMAGGSINLTLVSDEGESDGFLNGQLRLIFDILLLLFGPRTLAPPTVRRFNFLRHRDAVSTVVDTMLWLAAHQQSFLVESIELVDVNDFIRDQCVEALRAALEDVPHAQHAILFAGTKLVACFTKESAGVTLSNHDVFLLMLYMMGQFHGRARNLDETALPIADYTDHARAFQERDSLARATAEATGVPAPTPVASARLRTAHIDDGVASGVDSDDGFESAVDEDAVGSSELFAGAEGDLSSAREVRAVEEIVSIACPGRRIVEPIEDSQQLELRQAAAAVRAAYGVVQSRLRTSSPDLGLVLSWCLPQDDIVSQIHGEVVDLLLPLAQHARSSLGDRLLGIEASALNTVLAEKSPSPEKFCGAVFAALLIRAGEQTLSSSGNHLPGFQKSRGLSSPVVAFAGASTSTAAVLGGSGKGRLRHLASSSTESISTAARDRAVLQSDSSGLGSDSDDLTDNGVASDTLDGLNLTDEGNTSASSTSSDGEYDGRGNARYFADQVPVEEESPQEPVYSALFLHTASGGTALASNWCYFGELQDPISVVIVNSASSVRASQRDEQAPPSDGCTGSAEERDRLTEKQAFIKRALVNYIDYLVTKERAHLSILSFLHQLPGLIHFIFVDRTAERVLAPTIGPLHGSECAAALNSDSGEREGEDASERMRRILQQEVWQMCYLANRYVSQGYCSMSVRAGNFRYNYRLWLEDSRGEEVQITQDIAKLGGERGNMYNELVERTPRAARCYELYTLFISLVPSHLIFEYERRLVSLVKPSKKQ
jgi:Third Longin domain of FUZ, MON1 and HPS1